MKHVVTAARILVTAFGAFPGAPVNPTEAILARLRRRRSRLARLGIDFHGTTIPVVYGAIDAHLQRAVAAYRPDAILHLGLAGRRRAVSVETRAANRVNILHPDAAGQLPRRAALRPGGPPFLPCSWPAREIEAAIGRLRIPVARSIDAGDYVCNATLYHALLHQCGTCVGLLHVPKPRDRRRSVRLGRRDPTIDQLAEAAFAALLLMTRPARRPLYRSADAAPKAPPRDAGPEDRPRPERVPDAAHPAA